MSAEQIPPDVKDLIRDKLKDVMVKNPHLDPSKVNVISYATNGNHH